MNKSLESFSLSLAASFAQGCTLVGVSIAEFAEHGLDVEDAISWAQTNHLRPVREGEEINFHSPIFRLAEQGIPAHEILSRLAERTDFEGMVATAFLRNCGGLTRETCLHSTLAVTLGRTTVEAIVTKMIEIGEIPGDSPREIASVAEAFGCALTFFVNRARQRELFLEWRKRMEKIDPSFHNIISRFYGQLQ